MDSFLKKNFFKIFLLFIAAGFILFWLHSSKTVKPQILADVRMENGRIQNLPESLKKLFVNWQQLYLGNLDAQNFLDLCEQLAYQDQKLETDRSLHSLLYTFRSFALKDKENYQAARLEAKKALKLNDKNALAFFVMYEIAMVENNFREAADYLDGMIYKGDLEEMLAWMEEAGVAPLNKNSEDLREELNEEIKRLYKASGEDKSRTSDLSQGIF